MIKLSNSIERDLLLIADYMADENPQRAIKFIRAIKEEFLRIGRNPQIYQLRPEIGDGLRMAVFGRYVILFRIVAEDTWIERVVFGGRDLPPLFQ